MKMAYLIIWYLKYVFLFPPSSFLISWPPLPSFRYVCQWVSELWTRRGIPVRRPSAGSATPRLWREGAVCEHHDPAVSTTIILQLTHALGAWEGLPCLSLTLTVHLFVCVCNTSHVQCLGESQYIRVMRKGTAVRLLTSGSTVKVQTNNPSLVCLEVNHFVLWFFELQKHTFKSVRFASSSLKSPVTFQYSTDK